MYYPTETIAQMNHEQSWPKFTSASSHKIVHSRLALVPVARLVVGQQSARQVAPEGKLPEGGGAWPGDFAQFERLVGRPLNERAARSSQSVS